MTPGRPGPPPSGPRPGRALLTDALLLAVGTLTAVPVPAPSRVDRRVAGTALALAVVPALLTGTVGAAAVAAGSGLGLPPALAAVAAVAAVALAGRGLHLDGLADTADGLAASHDRERALAVMRTGDVGPLGAATLVLVLLAQVTALGEAVAAGAATGAAAVVVAVLAGRTVLPLLCVLPWPAARADGLGAAVAGTVRLLPALAAAGVALALAAGLAAAGGVAAGVGVAAVVVGWVGGLAVAAHAVRRLGGTTGDVLGAAVEAATTGALVVLAAAT